MNNTHVVTINDRNNINISGITKIDNFDKNEFFINTIMGTLLIKGEDLEIIKLDTIDGNLIIKGKINSLVYEEETKKENSFVNRLFK